MQRFFVPSLLPAVGDVVSLGPLHHQLRHVLRVQPGAQFVLLDNQGSERLMEVVGVERRDTTARVAEVRPAAAEPAVAVTLYQCLLKSDKLELVWQKATELGVTTLVPVVSQRTVARPGRALQNKQARWEAIAREAAEQCGRGRLPVVAPIVSFAEALTRAQGTRLLAWEEGTESRGLLHTLTNGMQPVETVSLLIGPEGGLEADEVEEARQAGWQVVSLGGRILRAETATVAALAVVTAALGELGDAPMLQVHTSAKESNDEVISSEVSSDTPASTEGEHKKLSSQDGSKKDGSDADERDKVEVNVAKSHDKGKGKGKSTEQGSVGDFTINGV